MGSAAARLASAAECIPGLFGFVLFSKSQIDTAAAVGLLSKARGVVIENTGLEFYHKGTDIQRSKTRK